MKYSRWIPDRGGYEVFEDGRRLDLGNDVERPVLRASSPIGASSVVAGRPLSRGARRVGTSPVPLGMVTVTRPSQALGGVPVTDVMRHLPAIGLGALVGWGACTLFRRNRGR